MALDDVAQTWFISEMGDAPTEELKAKAVGEIGVLLNGGKIYPEDIANLKEGEDMPKFGDSYDYSKPMKKATKKAPKKAKKTGKKAAKK